ncbi:hypothetical protein M3J09_010974 [Ascochyta lentis]
MMWFQVEAICTAGLPVRRDDAPGETRIDGTVLLALRCTLHRPFRPFCLDERPRVGGSLLPLPTRQSCLTTFCKRNFVSKQREEQIASRRPPFETPSSPR